MVLSLETTLILIMIVAINFIFLKMKIPLMQICIGSVTVVIMFLVSDLPFFPFSNLIVGLIALGNLLDSVNALKVF